MKIQLTVIGHKMPTWIDQGVKEYIKRLPHDYALQLKEIKPNKSSAVETQQLLAAALPHSKIIAFDRNGQSPSSTELAQSLATWHDQSINLSLLVGGADGLSAEGLAQADETWSLSKLTLPHQLVRIVVAEQIYRAWTIINNHPYHR